MPQDFLVYFKKMFTEEFYGKEKEKECSVITKQERFMLFRIGIKGSLGFSPPSLQSDTRNKR